MTKHVNDYLISAYIDGRVSDSERQAVERALHESDEKRKLYEQLVALRNNLRDLPRSSAPEGLADRVMDRIAEAQPRLAGSNQTVSRQHKMWRRVGWGIIATTACAALLIAWWIAPRLPERETVQNAPDRQESPETAVTPSAPDRPESRDDRIAVGTEGRHDTYVFVVDVAITPAGQAGQVFSQALRSAAIALAPDMLVDERLEQKLLDNRFVGDVQPVGGQADGPKPGEATIEMVYVSGTGREIEMAIADLRSRPPDQVAHVRFDMTLEPKERDLFRQLHRATQMASDQPDPEPKARRLVFRFVLRGTAGASLGTISHPAIRAEWEPVKPDGADSRTASNLANGSAQRLGKGTDDATARATPLPMMLPSDGEQPGEDTLYEVLFILRKLDQQPPADPAVP